MVGSVIERSVETGERFGLVLISPELSMVALAIVVILLDLFVKNKGVLAIISMMGLLVPFILTVSLWGENDTTFNGMLTIDNFALFFKFAKLSPTMI